MSLNSFHVSCNGYSGNDPIVEGFIGSIRLAWVVCLMFIQDDVPTRGTFSSVSNGTKLAWSMLRIYLLICDGLILYIFPHMSFILCCLSNLR